MPKSKKPKRRFNAARFKARTPVGETGYRGNQAMIAKVLKAADSVALVIPKKRGP